MFSSLFNLSAARFIAGRAEITALAGGTLAGGTFGPGTVRRGWAGRAVDGLVVDGLVVDGRAADGLVDGRTLSREMSVSFILTRSLSSGSR